MIKEITLQNFRKFKKDTFEFDSNIVVFWGNNAQGKSSILEAIHLITNGKSPWSVSDEYVNFLQDDLSRHTRIVIQDHEHNYALYRDNNKKIHTIDDVKVSSKKFFSRNCSTIFNPERIDLLMLSPGYRRDFLDQTISSIDYEYPSILKKFKNVLRQRNSYLKKLSKQFYEKGIIARNDPQLNFWTKELIETCHIIYKKRLSLIENFNNSNFKIEYKTSGELGNLESEDLINAFEENKKRDIATGYTNIGPHRDDWSIFTDQDIKKYGSRGQKRLAVGNLIFKSHEIIAKEIDVYPILLLDDIASELDIKNTKKIFSKKLLSNQQTFITTVDKNVLPKYVQDNAQFIHLNGSERK